MNWQSMRSVMPPWPGMESPKSLILKERLRPEAKKPPKGAMREAKVARLSAWNHIGGKVKAKWVLMGRKGTCGIS
jgi:hypothetical protein